MELYTPKGWLNFRAVRDMGYPFTFVIGGRGTGKTFGALDTSIEDGLPFALMRRTQTQADLIGNPTFSPLRPICRERGLELLTRPIVKGISGFYRSKMLDGKRLPEGEPLGISCALSTLGNVRGFDGSAIRILIYDEFLPERGDRPLKAEADKFYNAYETINRNRELSGSPPLQAVLLGNSNDLGSPLLLKLDLVDRLESMQRAGKTVWTSDKRGIAVVLLRDSPVSAAKAGTALYRLAEGSEYSDMALGNAFAYEDRGSIRSRPLAEYRPVVGIGDDLTIYRHKSKRLYYVSRHRTGSPPVYSTGETDLDRLRRSYGWLYKEMLDGTLDYESYPCQLMLTKVMLW